MAVTLQREGRRVYLCGDTYPVRDRIKAIGGHWDGSGRRWWVGAEKAAEAEAIAAEAGALPAPEPGAPPEPRPPANPNSLRLDGKGEYKGRVYFIAAWGREGARCRLVTLPDRDGKFLDFWADAALVRVVKRYKPRTFRGRTEYTTLGSIARFVSDRREAEARGEPLCAACGGPGDLVEDLEDGLRKHRGCADLPPG